MNTKNFSMIALTALLLIAAACEKDEFASAPGVQATAQGSQAAAPSPANPTPAGGAGALPPGAVMPSDHPPVAPTDLAPRPQIPVTADRQGALGQSGPLRWTAPEGWRAVKPSSSMRLGEYHIAAGEGKSPSVMSIFSLGGGVEANITRWIGQFTQPDGASSLEKAKRDTLQIHGMNVHTVEVAGDYDAGAAMMGAKTQTPQRLLGAIVEAPSGLFFFKLLGEDEAVFKERERFDAFLASMKPGA